MIDCASGLLQGASATRLAYSGLQQGASETRLADRDLLDILFVHMVMISLKQGFPQPIFHENSVYSHDVTCPVGDHHKKYPIKALASASSKTCSMLRPSRLQSTLVNDRLRAGLK